MRGATQRNSSGQAGRAFETLDESAKEDFSAVVDAPTRRFEPEAKQQLFQVKLLAFEKKEDEDWATVGEKLKELASRAYPDSDDLADTGGARILL